MYPIQGVRALRKAVDTATGAFAVPDDAVVEEAKQASPATKSVLKKSLEVLKETSEAVGHVQKLKSALEALYSAVPYLKAIGQSVMDAIGKNS